MVKAALGCEVEVPTIHGSSKLKIPAGTQAGKRFTLQRQGVPSLRGGSRGDMVVEAQVQTPTKLTKKQKELLQEFDDQYHEEEEGFFSRLFHGHFKKLKKEEEMEKA
jgi:molecular chaperone DnaJ